MAIGQQVHGLLAQYSSRVGAAIYGHAHHRYQHTIDGIEYLSSAPSGVPLVCRTPGVGEFDKDGVVGFENLVLHADRTFRRETHAAHVRTTALDSGMD